MSHRTYWIAAVVVAGLLVAPGAASAFELECPCLTTEAPRGFGLTARASGSVLRPALAGQIGVHHQWQRWRLGVEMEWNGLIPVERPAPWASTLNSAIVVGYRHRLTESLFVRFELGLGMGVLLTDIYGYEAGTVGPLLLARALGIDLYVAPRVIVGIDLLDLVLVLYGWEQFPVLYNQLRAGISVTFFGSAGRR